MHDHGIFDLVVTIARQHDIRAVFSGRPLGKLSNVFLPITTT